MRKSRAQTLALMTCHADETVVELWSRPQLMPAGIIRPRSPRNWILRSQKDETDQAILERQRELEERGFRWEGCVDPEVENWRGCSPSRRGKS